MKLGAAIPVLNEWRFMPAVIGQLLKIVDRCVILRGTRSISGAPATLTPIPELDPRVEILEGNWESEAETRNAGMDYLSDCDHVFLVDSDEILLDDGLGKLKEMCRTGDYPVIAVRVQTYWKTPEFRIDPPEPGVIKMVLRKDQRIIRARDTTAPATVADVWCHHLSYVRTDEELQEKIRLWGHANEIRRDWYERVWKEWDKNPNMENLHPVHPTAYRRAIHDPHPELLSILQMSKRVKPAQTHWQKIDHIIGPATRDQFDQVGQKATRSAIENFIVQYSDPTTLVLDAGCSTGVEGHRLAQKGFRGSYLGVDSSAKAIVHGLANLSGLPASLLVSDLESIPFPDRRFDIVLMKDVIEHAPGYENLLREAARLAGRWFILSMFIKPHDANDVFREEVPGLFLNRYDRRRLVPFVQSLGFDAPFLIYEDEQDEVLVFKKQMGKEQLMDATSTHFPILAACVARTTGPVLELGCGDYSTPMLHLLCRNRRLVSIDSDANWLSRYEDFRSSTHELVHASDWANAGVIDANSWDVALVDHAPGTRRAPEIQRLMHRAKFIVIHDTEDPNYGYEPILSQFKFRYDYTRLKPWTSVVSMTEEFRP